MRWFAPPSIADQSVRVRTCRSVRRLRGGVPGCLVGYASMILGRSFPAFPTEAGQLGGALTRAQVPDSRALPASIGVATGGAPRDYNADTHATDLRPSQCSASGDVPCWSSSAPAGTAYLGCDESCGESARHVGGSSGSVGGGTVPAVDPGGGGIVPPFRPGPGWRPDWLDGDPSDDQRGP